ncbi:MAG: hypothetical protein ACLQVN_01130 [Bryobacteraceae bacterium]
MDKSVTWSAMLGTISSSGLYTAPSAAGTDTVTAVSNANNAMSATSTVTITAAAPPNAVSLLHFGNAGFGGDDTNVFQTALTSTAANGQTLEIPAGNYNISPISFPNNSNVFVDAGATVSANSGYGANSVMLTVYASNVTITGAGAAVSVFQMPLAQAASKADGSQSRHCLDVETATNVTITGISCNLSGGDGLYLRTSTNVTVTNCIFDHNFRQGSSITGQVNHINYVGDYFTNTSGTAPQSGIDIEPNSPSDYLLDINITNCYTNDNAGDGLMISPWMMNSTSQPIGITVVGHHSTGNQGYGYVGINGDAGRGSPLSSTDNTNAPGTILIHDSFSDQSGSYGACARFYAANGANLTFQNLTITTPNVNGPDPSYGDSGAVEIVRGGGGTVPQGNVYFVNVNIASTDGNTTYYFNFNDGSGVGTTNVEFEPGTLSGATKAPPNGLVQGVATSVID